MIANVGDGKSGNSSPDRWQASDVSLIVARRARASGRKGRALSELRVHNDELRTVREASRDLGRVVDSLERGDLAKVVLTQRNRMRAVVLSVERYAEIELALAASGNGSAPSVQVVDPQPART